MMFEQCPTRYLLMRQRVGIVQMKGWVSREQYLHLYPCTLPTAPVSRSFGLRSSYEIDILDTCTDQRPRNKKLSKWPHWTRLRPPDQIPTIQSLPDRRVIGLFYHQPPQLLQQYCAVNRWAFAFFHNLLGNYWARNLHDPALYRSKDFLRWCMYLFGTNSIVSTTWSNVDPC